MLVAALIIASLIFVICLYCCFRVSSMYDQQMEELEKNKVTETEVP